MKSRTLIGTIAASLFAALAAHQSAAQEQQPKISQTHYYVFDLGTSLGGTSSGASSINNPGWIAGGANLSGNTAVHAVLWLGAPMDLGTLGGPNSNIAWPNKNNTGELVGIAETADIDPLGENWSCSAFFPTVTGHVCLGFAWENGVMSALPTLGGNNGYATGVNNRGQVVGWAENATHDPTCVPPQVLQFEAVIWGPRLGQLQELPPLAGDLDGAATAINNKGQVVGISGTCDNAVGEFTAAHALLWDNGKPINIGNLGGVAWNTPTAINNQGQVVGFSDLPGDESGAPNYHAFLWTKAHGIQDLGTLPGDVYSAAFGINEQGQIVGQSISAGFASSRAFIWQNGKMTDLSTLIQSGSTLSPLYANDINDRGELVGQAYDSGTGDTPAFLATPTLNGIAAEAASSTSHGKNDTTGIVLPENIREQLLRRSGLGALSSWTPHRTTEQH